MLILFLCREFLLLTPCCLHFYGESFSYTSRAVLIFMEGVSLTHPVLALLFSSGEFLLHILCWFIFIIGEFLLHIPCWPPFCPRNFCYASHVGLIFVWGVSLTHPVLASFLSGGVSLTHPVLASLLSGKFLSHMPCWLYFSVGSFSYTSHAGFFCFNLGSFSCASRAGFSFIWGSSFKHPVLASFLCGEFLLHFPC